MSSAMSVFAQTIYENKYAHMLNGSVNRKEVWAESAGRVAGSVMDPYLPQLSATVRRFIEERKLMPGGRYLASAGRKFPQCNNCFLFSVEDSREGWGGLMDKITNSLMTGGGIGVVYSKIRRDGAGLKRMGGESTGPCSLMQMVNEAGRHIMQGGSRRSAIWAGLHWHHPDVFRFIKMKDWPEYIKEAKEADFNAPGPMDGTNISVILDDDFFAAYRDPTWVMHYKLGGETHKVDHNWACDVYWQVIRHMLMTGEPGFSVDIGDNAGEHCRNAPVHGDTRVLTAEGYQRAADLVGTPSIVWTGKQWVGNVEFKKTAEMVPTVRVSMTGHRDIVCDPTHPFLVETYLGAGVRRKLVSVDRVKASDLQEGDIVSVALPEPAAKGVDEEAYTLGFVYGDGSFVAKQRAEVTICHESKSDCASRFSAFSHSKKVDARGYSRYYFQAHSIFKGRSKKVSPPSVSPRWDASFLAGLFDADGNFDPTQKRIRLASSEEQFLVGVARMLESIGILSNISKGGPSGFGGRRCWQLVVAADYMVRFMEVVPTLRVRANLEGYESYRKSTVKVLSVTPDEPADVYCADVGVEEHSFCAEGVLVSNCTEVVSSDDSDMCNLASINMSRIQSMEEMAEVTEAATAFLMCGTLYSKLPTETMYRVREKNRRLGLGLMGVHEWLLRRGKRYEPDDELGKWLEVYARSGSYANRYADKLSISRPVATRAVAPTGTISIVAETTSGIEPIYAVAFKRRYLDGKEWKAQYVIDATAERLIADGVDHNLIEDAVTLAEDVERRMRFQAWVQSYVDHGISSTINLPPWGSPLNNESKVTSFGQTLLKYLPQLRGITAYPDGSRGGQPLTRVPYEEAKGQVGVEFVDNAEMGCKSGVCGS